ncbi:hypothetical protein FACS189447_09530 [Spirochaetia bacterium]|nr:hypothetical protein FACS189447_09530 [Spirochaetia bacterium]
MDGEAVKNIETLIAKTVFKDVGDKTFGRDAKGDIKPVFFEPRPQPVILHTLSGLVDYIKANVDKINPEKHLINIESPSRISLVSAIGGIDRQRDVIAVSEIEKELQTYRFGQYQEVEPFIISLNSLFEDTEDKDRLARYVSRIKGGTTFSLEDDGITQVAEVTKGIAGAVTEKESAPKIVNLKPFRTFRDIDQPESGFLFRLKLIDTDEHTVGACLYESDGGRWRIDAVQSIKKYLEEKVKIAIIA